MSGGFNFDNHIRNSFLQSAGLPAPKATSTGTTIVGLKFKDGVILGADTRATAGPIIADKNCEKIHYIAPNIWCGGAGTAADTEFVTAMISSQLELHSMSVNRQPRVVTAMTLLKQHLFKYQGHVGAYLIVGGVDPTGAQLMSIHAHGSTDKLPYTCLGSGSLAAMAIFETRWRPDMSREEGMELVADAIKSGIFNDLGSGSNVDVAVITKDNTEVFRGFEKPNQRGQREDRYQYKRGTTRVLGKEQIHKFMTVETLYDNPLAQVALVANSFQTCGNSRRRRHGCRCMILVEDTLHSLTNHHVNALVHVSFVCYGRSISHVLCNSESNDGPWRMLWRMATMALSVDLRQNKRHSIHCKRACAIAFCDRCRSSRCLRLVVLSSRTIAHGVPDEQFDNLHMSRAMMSPPITPPPGPGVKSEFDTTRVDSCKEDPHNIRSTMTRSDSLLCMSDGPLQGLLVRFRELQQSLNSSSTARQGGPSYESCQDLLKTGQEYTRFLATALLVVEELDAEDDVEFAQSNKAIVPAVEAGLLNFGDNLDPFMNITPRSSDSDEKADLSTDITNIRNSVAARWNLVQQLMAKIKIQVNASSDWGDCQESLDAIDFEERELRSSIFLMEEQRHVTLPALSVGLDVLTTILKESPEGEDTGTPGKKVHKDGLSQWDRANHDTIMRLTSKISPLRASLAMFAPRLDAFANRAQGQFPSAVTALSARYETLKDNFESLLADFRKLRNELAEDKWMAVFRQVNKQASEMMNSLERTMKKLDTVSLNSTEASNLIQSFEMKAEHYGKSVPAVLAVMQKGVRDRATLNGEILRGHDLLIGRWTQLSSDLEDMSRRVRAVRNVTVKAPSKAASIEAKSVRSMSSLLRVPKMSSTVRCARSPQRDEKNESVKTPSALSRSIQHTSVVRSSSPSPATFRKDISMDFPRSHSRLSMTVDRPLPQTPSNRPPWNAGTIARLPAATELTPTRPASRIATIRPGATSSLGQTRSHTPLTDRRRTGSLLPTKSPRKSILTATSGNAIPPLPATPSQATIDRLSKPKAPIIGIGQSLLPKVPSTPTGIRTTLARPKTPASIAAPRRVVSNPASSISRLMTVMSSDRAGHDLRAGSAIGNRRQSNIPMPNPMKTAGVGKM